MKENKAGRWLYRLLPIVLGIFLIAGAVGLMAPTATFAQEAATPPALNADVTFNMPDNLIEITFEDDPDWRTVISAVYVDDAVLDASDYTTDTSGKITIDADVFTTTKDYEIIIQADGYTDASVTQRIEEAVLEIKGAGVETPRKYTMSHLQGLDQYQQLYSTINTWPTKKFYVVEGVKLTPLLNEAGIKDEATLIKFTSSDGFNKTLTWEQFTAPRYYYPGLKENHEFFGYIEGSPDGAQQVDAMLALRSADNSTNPAYMTTANAPLLILGQQCITEQTNELFVKYMAVIEVFTETPTKWANPTATPVGGTVSAGDEVVLTNQYNDADKIHYTLDGSDPTIESPMYNWIAKRWWSSRADDLADINHPIVLTKDTTIKAVTIGPGHEDSDIVEFTYTVDEPDPIAVTGVRISEEDQNLEESKTVQLTAVVAPENATNKAVSWTSSNEAVATVDADGLVTAVSPGTATITVTTNDGNFTDTVTVTVASGEPTTPPTLSPDINDNTVGNAIHITFTDDADWRAAITGITVEGSALTSAQYTVAEGSISIISSVFTTAGDHEVVVSATGYSDAVLTQIIGVAEAAAITITGDGVPADVELTLSQVLALTEVTHDYSAINNYPTKDIGFVGVKGVKLQDILDLAQIKDEAKLITIKASDGLTQIFTRDELLAQPRYYFPGLMEDSSDGKVLVPTILSTDMLDKNGLRLIMGQRAVTEQNKPWFVKKVIQVIVSTDEPGKWDSVSADVAEGVVAPRTKVALGHTSFDGVKIYYTLDGSTPDVNSNMYNKSASYYQPELNVPIEITEDTTIKAVAIGPGREDSDIVEFTYTVDEPDPIAVTGVSIAEEDQELSVDQTVQLTAVVEPADATNKAVTWSSSNEAVATVSDSGLVTAVAEGTATITVTTEDGGFTDTVTATVVGESTTDVLYDGTVTLAPAETFDVTPHNSSVVYTVYENTPLGALQAAATAGGFTYGVTDKNYPKSGALLLDNVGDYDYDDPGEWYAYVNDVYKDGFNNPDGALNLIQVVHGDRAEFYYAAGIDDPEDLAAVQAAATAAVKTVVATGVTPTDWTLQLSGAKDETVTKAEFEQALACASSGHQVSWTDGDDVWGGVPLWLLVAMVDDDPDVGSDHFNFNDDLADQNYEVNVVAGDGWKATFDSDAIARNDGYIVANTLNGKPLPLQTEGGKGCWPLHLKGSAVFGGQQVGNIVRIELSGLPQPPEGWTLEMIGEVGDTITQEEFEEGLACTGSGHYREWTDNEGKVWSGVPLWVLLGTVDDIETGSHWTFDDSLPADYSVKVEAGDGFSKTFTGTDVARSDDYIVANECDGEPLTGSSAPLRLVGDGVANDGSLGGSAVGNIVRIEIPELQTPDAAPGSWNLTLTGKISDVISQAEFEAGLACPDAGHLEEWTDGDGNVWSGMPLWLLTGWVDDRQPHDYDANQAIAGYTILVKAEDGYAKDFASADVASSNDYIIANKCNGEALDDSWPLRLVGDGVANDGSLTGASVGNVVEIELTNFETAPPIPEVRIVKYDEDGTTVLDEITVDCLWMEGESELDVIGDGTTVYKFEGITNDPDDVWDADETYPGGFKIANAVKGTRIRDLCDLVGGMGAGTEIVLTARDGFETRLPYSSIYPDPAVQERQGDAILAWWSDGEYIPDYADGMRLFFTPDDYIYGQWDMHETLPENYWHYYYNNDVQYPSCAGLAAKWIAEIEIYSVPQGDWVLELDGRDIGGINYEVSKTYFEQALACQFGAEHKATYTDSQGRVWEGMPLWLLAGFVDDADQHSDNAFNDALAEAGYQVVITADDGYAVTIDSADIIRNSDYIVANTLDGAPIPESDDSWPLRLVGPAVSGSTSVGQIVSIELVSSERPSYGVNPANDAAYTIGQTIDGISIMTVNNGVSGFKYFSVGIGPVIPNSGEETVVFTHLRNDSQLELNATGADFDQVETAQAGFNVQPGDVVKAYIVDELTNEADHNPVMLQ